MPAHIKDGGVWKPVNNTNVKDAGVWKRAEFGYVKDGGVWKRFGRAASNSYLTTNWGVILKIDYNGDVVWTYGEPTSDYEYRMVAVDADGYVYAPRTDRRVLKISPNGVLVWDIEIPSYSPGAIAVDLNGNVYYGRGAEFNKVDSNGNHVWTFDTSPYGQYGSTVSSLAVDQYGNVHAGLENQYDPRIVKVNPSGSAIWAVLTAGRFPTPLVVDRDGNTYVATGLSSQDDQGVVTKTDSSGNQVWQWTDPEGEDITGMAVDQYGNVYTTNAVGKTRKHSPDANPLWEVLRGGASSNRRMGLAVDPSGNVYVTSGGELHKIDNDGNIVWETEGVPGWGLSVAADPGLDGAGFW